MFNDLIKHILYEELNVHSTTTQHYIFNQPLEVKNSILTSETNYIYMKHTSISIALINYNKGRKTCSTKLFRK